VTGRIVNWAVHAEVIRISKTESCALRKEIFNLVKSFPSEGKFRLADQLFRKTRRSQRGTVGFTIKKTLNSVATDVQIGECLANIFKDKAWKLSINFPYRNAKIYT